MKKPVGRVGALMVLGLIVFGASAHAEENSPPAAMHLGDGEGRIIDPDLAVPSENYRETWVFLGSFSVLADEPEEGAKEMHAVYAEREAVRAYLASGIFPDGAKLIKDVYETETEYLTTGTASYAKELAGRFVMVKDSQNTKAGTSPLWGDGWGWAFYEGAEMRRTVTTDYESDCLGCHQPAQATDFLYTQGYPLLAR
ncbi:cytochrome P460 family protein [Parvibaculaceae bacterium PLY_AMNH_Bact1]|nr:cytochrome P460 family protein [Parvibaculaceae bacterium PLY_AMNH_Bact1]